MSVRESYRQIERDIEEENYPKNIFRVLCGKVYSMGRNII
jgi:hypothetical protein